MPSESLLPTARAAPRVPCGLDATLETSHGSISCVVLDISLRGAAVEIAPAGANGAKAQPKTPQSDDSVTLRIAFPHGGTGFSGKVSRPTDQSGTERDFGVRFAPLSAEQQTLIDQYVFLRTCQFGWLNRRRWLLHKDHLFATLFVSWASGLVFALGGIELLDQLFSADKTSNELTYYLKTGLVLGAFALFSLVTTQAVSLFLGPPSWREALLFVRDPSVTYRQHREAIRREFGYSEVEMTLLCAPRPAPWRQRASWSMWVQMGLIFTLCEWAVLAALR